MMFGMTAGKMKRTITLDADVATAVEAEAARSHGGNVSAWLNAVARRETLRAAYQRAAEAERGEQSGLGVDRAGERLAAYVDERLAMRADIAGEDTSGAV